MRTHGTRVELTQPIPSRVEVGAGIALALKVTCDDGCDLQGESIVVRTPEGALLTTERLAHHAAGCNETAEFFLRAPAQAGEHTWYLVLPRHEREHIVHEEAVQAVSFTTLPHKTSVAIWDFPSPVPTTGSFRAKVGVKCSARCHLAGHRVEVLDESGMTMGEGRLGESVWEGTEALQWGVAEIAAPATKGLRSWTARFRGIGLELAHEDASVQFSFLADPPPDHRITIKVIGEDTRAPIACAHVRLGFYTSETDEAGLAVFEVPGGRHAVRIWKDGYTGPLMSVDVTEDSTIEVAALKALTEAEREERARQLEAASWG